MTSLTLAWSTARARRAARPKRTPLLLLFVAWLARRLPSLKRARTAVMQWSAFTAGTVALWGVDWRAGLAGVFVSLLVLEALGGAER